MNNGGSLGCLGQYVAGVWGPSQVAVEGGQRVREEPGNWSQLSLASLRVGCETSWRLRQLTAARGESTGASCCTLPHLHQPPQPASTQPTPKEESNPNRCKRQHNWLDIVLTAIIQAPIFIWPDCFEEGGEMPKEMSSVPSLVFHKYLS